MQKSQSTLALSSIHPQMYTPIDIYNIQQILKKCKLYIKFFKIFILDA